MLFKDRGVDGANFLKLKAGESVRGVFQGGLFEFKQHWKDNKGVVCAGDGCAICTDATEEKGPAFRFRINFILKENEAYTAKIFEQGGKVYDQLKSYQDEGYELDKHLVKITRQGAGTDTKYSIVPILKGELNESQLETISKIPLIPLTKTSQAAESEHASVPGDEEDLPF